MTLKNTKINKYLSEDEEDIKFNWFDDFTNEEMLDECISRLTDIDKKIIDYEQYIDELWSESVEPQMLISDLCLNFSDKFDFFNYMIGKKEYRYLINKQSMLNKQIEYIYRRFNNTT